MSRKTEALDLAAQIDARACELGELWRRLHALAPSRIKAGDMRMCLKRAGVPGGRDDGGLHGSTLRARVMAKGKL